MRTIQLFKITAFSMVLGLPFVASAANAEEITICGTPDNMGIGSEITVSQWLPGTDPLAPVMKRGHWRVINVKIKGLYCPAIEVEKSQPKIYIRLKSADGTIVTRGQYQVWSLDTSYDSSYTGDYELYLDTEPNPENSIYQSYKVPSKLMSNGNVMKSPTITMSTDGKWERSYPLTPGFEERTISDDTIAIVIE